MILKIIDANHVRLEQLGWTRKICCWNAHGCPLTMFFFVTMNDYKTMISISRNQFVNSQAFLKTHHGHRKDFITPRWLICPVSRSLFRPRERGMRSAGRESYWLKDNLPRIFWRVCWASMFSLRVEGSYFRGWSQQKFHWDSSRKNVHDILILWSLRCDDHFSDVPKLMNHFMTFVLCHDKSEIFHFFLPPVEDPRFWICKRRPSCDTPISELMLSF